MKLRIEGNSIRLRLKKSEIDLFGKINEVNDVLSIGNITLVYSLKSYSGNEIMCELLAEELNVYIPEKLAQNWIETDLVSLENIYQDCKILIEKDFKCTSSSCEESQKDQSDFFENPKENVSR